MTSPGAPLADWLGRLAARSPSPSGGSAAAVCLASAAALAGMVARFSAGTVPDAEDLARVADDMREQALGLAAADEAAVAALYPGGQPAQERPPGGDDRVRAAEVPVAMVGLAGNLRPVLARLARDGNPRLAGDARVGLELLDGAAAAAASLVRDDLVLLDEETRGRVLAAFEEAEARLLASRVDG